MVQVSVQKQQQQNTQFAKFNLDPVECACILSHTYIHTYTHTNSHTVTLTNVKTEKERLRFVCANKSNNEIVCYTKALRIL